jgi:hypothetical protein
VLTIVKDVVELTAFTAQRPLKLPGLTDARYTASPALKECVVVVTDQRPVAEPHEAKHVPGFAAFAIVNTVALVTDLTV